MFFYLLYLHFSFNMYLIFLFMKSEYEKLH